MKDEIKEIIEYFKDDIDFLEVELKYPNFKGRYITIRDKECGYLKKLLDYITNLQEEIKELEKDKSKMFETAVKRNNQLLDRIDNAIEHLKEVMKDEEEYEEDYIYNKYLLDILQGSDKE